MSREFIELFRSNNATTSSSVTLCYAGKESCKPGHRFGPAARAHYLIHFVLRGKGKFTTNRVVYPVHANQLFLIKPGEPSYYIADDQEPWEYIWVAIMGKDVTAILEDCGLLSRGPVMSFQPQEKLLNALEDTIYQLSSHTENEYSLLGDLYTVFGCLAKEYRDTASQCENLYLKQAVNFIQNNYSHNIRIQDIADYLQIDRTYLYRLFMDEFHLSPKQYLLKYQIRISLQLLTNSKMQIKEVAYSCGFSDPAAFSKYFYKELGFTPKEFRHIDGDAILSYVNRQMPADPQEERNQASVHANPADA